MARRKPKPPIGSIPGTLVISKDASFPSIRAIRFDSAKISEYEISKVEQLSKLLGSDSILWVDVQGLGDERILRNLGACFKIHPLALEDVVHTPQRPKSEDYKDQHLVIVRMVRGVDKHTIDSEQVSVLIGDRYVVTFQDRYGDILDPVRKRLRDAAGRIRSKGADYLAYAIVDTIIDGYFPVVEQLGETLQELENLVIHSPNTAVLADINAMRSQLVSLRRSIWPQRDAINALLRDQHRFVTDDTRVYLRDTYDHAVQLVEILESHREVASSLVSTHLSVLGNRTNEVMKVLTIMASIFIPLTFIAGIYGMNFEHMPELRQRWAYPALWGVMVSVGGGLFLYFRRKGWIGSE